MRALVGLIVAFAAMTASAVPTHAQDDDPLARWRFFLEQRRSPGLTTSAMAARLQTARRQTLLRPVRSVASGSAFLLGTNWEPLGPEVIPWFIASSGRASTVAFHPTDPQTLYVGGAQAGIWKSTNGGASWTPLTDDQCSLAMGSIALDPVDPEIVYAGTGEAHFSGDSYYGCGVLRSLDGGGTWEHMDDAEFIPASGWGGARTSRIRIDPLTAGSSTTTRVYAATDFGFVLSENSGQTWRETKDGVMTDLLLDPSDPSVLYLAHSGVGVFRSDDAGETWSPLPVGIPEMETGRINLALAPSAPQTVYAVVEDRRGVLQGFYRSTDGGTSWANRAGIGAGCGNQCWYDLALEVDPDDPETVYFGGIGLFRSDDGAGAFTDITNGIHVDQHLIVGDGAHDRLFVVNDGGIYRSLDQGASWTSLNTNLAMTQFYAGISLHPSDPAVILGGTQDNGTLQANGSSTWPLVVGGDGGFTAINPVTPEVRYGETQWGGGFSGPRRSIAGGPWLQVIDGIDLDDPAIFIPPLVMDPYEPTVLYFGTDRVYRTIDGGDAWAPISPHFPGARLTGIAPALTDARVVYASTNGGMQVTVDGGESWIDRSAGLPSRWISNVAVHPDEPSVAYAAVSGFGTGHVFRSTDFGASWTDISSGLPDLPVNAVLIDPQDPDVLYLGTDLGVWVGTSSGAWERLGEGMPMVAVFDLAVESGTGRLVAATHGRGMFGLPVEVPPTVRLRAPPEPTTVTTAEPEAEGEIRVGAAGSSWPLLAWSASTEAAWLSLAPADGVGRGRLGWSVDAKGLEPGMYEADIEVTLDVGAASATVPLSIEVVPSDTLIVEGLSRSTVLLVGSTDPVPDSLVVGIRGAGAAEREWVSSHGEGTWLDLLTATGGDGDTLRWVRRPDGLPAGVYVDTLRIELPRAVGSPARVVDTLRIEPPATATPAGPSSAGVSLAALALDRPDSLRIDLVGFGADTTRWQATHGSAPWLTLVNDEGESGDLLRWVRRADALPAGIHVDTLTVWPRGAPERASQVVDTFRVSPPVPASDAAGELLDGTRLDAVQRELLDRLGNDDGTFNLGDVLAWLARCASGGCAPASTTGGGR